MIELVSDGRATRLALGDDALWLAGSDAFSPAVAGAATASLAA